jgi:hypothetical protein
MVLNLIKVGDDLYTVVRTIPEHKGIDVDVFKRSTNSTNVFRKDGLFWFCRIVEEAQIATDEEPVIEPTKKRGRPKKQTQEN